MDATLKAKRTEAQRLLTLARQQGPLHPQTETHYREALTLLEGAASASQLTKLWLEFSQSLAQSGANQSYVDALLEVTQRSQSPGLEREHAIALNALGAFFLTQGQNHEAIAYWRQAYHVAADAKLLGIAAPLATNLGKLLSQEGHPDEALAFFEHARDAAQRHGADQEFGAASIDMARLLRLQGTLDRAENILKEAMRALQDQGNATILADLYTERGLLALAQGHTERAKRYFEVDQRIAESTGDPRGQIRALSHLGTTYAHLADLQTSRDHYREALQRATDAQLPGAMAQLEANLANLDGLEGKFGDAIQRLEAAQAVHTHPAFLLVTQLLLGQFYAKDTQLSRAKAALQDALHRAQELQDNAHAGRAQFALAALLHAQGEVQQAQTAALSAMPLIETHGTPSDLFMARIALIEFALVRGDEATITPLLAALKAHPLPPRESLDLALIEAKVSLHLQGAAAAPRVTACLEALQTHGRHPEALGLHLLALDAQVLSADPTTLQRLQDQAERFQQRALSLETRSTLAALTGDLPAFGPLLQEAALTENSLLAWRIQRRALETESRAAHTLSDDAKAQLWHKLTELHQTLSRQGLQPEADRLHRLRRALHPSEPALPD